MKHDLKVSDITDFGCFCTVPILKVS